MRPEQKIIVEQPKGWPGGVYRSNRYRSVEKEMKLLDWKLEGKPEKGKVIVCLTKKNAICLVCTYRGGPAYSINGLVEGQIHESKVRAWRYK